jgi:hypothetical protein
MEIKPENKIFNKIFEELDVTDQHNTYFDTVKEWVDFSNRIKDQFEDLQERNFTNICFRFDTNSYSEYEDAYTDVRLVFSWERELTEEELQAEQEIQQTREEDERIFSELCGKLSTNSIGSIISNDDLRKLYLEGNIKI